MLDLTNVQLRDFEVQIGDRPLLVRLVSQSSERLAEEPALLLHFAMSAEDALYSSPYCLLTKTFLEHGHRVLSFDLSQHGSRIDDFGEGITGWRNAFFQNHDPFVGFIEEAQSVINHCINVGLAQTGNIAVAGTSRAGYLALRWLAEDNRLAAAAAFAPVTDWRVLTEFASDAHREAVGALGLSNYAGRLASKPIYMVIGEQDERVSTASCREFYTDLRTVNAGLNFPNELLHFEVQQVPGHDAQPCWYEAGARFLMRELSRSNATR